MKIEILTGDEAREAGYDKQLDGKEIVWPLGKKAREECCKQCGKPFTTGWRRRRSYCSDSCALQARRIQRRPNSRLYYRNNIARVKKNSRVRHLRRKFGITLSDYESLENKQRSVCAICKQPDLTRQLAVDHDHETGIVRGLLCYRCNTGLGVFRDSVQVIRQSTAYLMKHALKQSFLAKGFDVI